LFTSHIGTIGNNFLEALTNDDIHYDLRIPFGFYPDNEEYFELRINNEILKIFTDYYAKLFISSKQDDWSIILKYHFLYLIYERINILKGSKKEPSIENNVFIPPFFQYILSNIHAIDGWNKYDRKSEKFIPELMIFENGKWIKFMKYKDTGPVSLPLTHFGTDIPCFYSTNSISTNSVFDSGESFINYKENEKRSVNAGIVELIATNEAIFSNRFSTGLDILSAALLRVYKDNNSVLCYVDVALGHILNFNLYFEFMAGCTNTDACLKQNCLGDFIPYK
jgi:hypothetical protein